MTDIIAAIRDANPTRNRSNLHRRIMKLAEEFGEVSEAYLNVTSTGNGKGMTWDDVREEFADLLIVAVDVALTPMELKNSQSLEDMTENLHRELRVAKNIDGYGFPITNLDELMLETMDRLGHLVREFHKFKRDEHSGIYQFERVMRYVVSICATATQTVMPDQIGISVEALEENLAKEIDRKLAKWARNRNTAATDGTD